MAGRQEATVARIAERIHHAADGAVGELRRDQGGPIHIDPLDRVPGFGQQSKACTRVGTYCVRGRPGGEEGTGDHGPPGKPQGETRQMGHPTLKQSVYRADAWDLSPHSRSIAPRPWPAASRSPRRSLPSAPEFRSSGGTPPENSGLDLRATPEPPWLRGHTIRTIWPSLGHRSILLAFEGQRVIPSLNEMSNPFPPLQ